MKRGQELAGQLEEADEIGEIVLLAAELDNVADDLLAQTRAMPSASDEVLAAMAARGRRLGGQLEEAGTPNEIVQLAAELDAITDELLEQASE